MLRTNEGPALVWQSTFGRDQFAENILLTRDSVITFLGSAGFLPGQLGGTLVALDRSSGNRQWETPIPFDDSGILLLVADDETVFSVTDIGVNAYNLANGGRRWSSALGAGHVEVGALSDGNVVRVYYGDSVIELNKATGIQLSHRQKASSLWQIGDTELFEDQSSKIAARRLDTGQNLWFSDLERSRIDDPWTPQLTEIKTLIVHPVSGRLGDCALDLRTGQVSWCTDDMPRSNFSIDHSEGIGWYLRSDFALVGVSLANGTHLRTVHFEPSELPGSMQRMRFPYWVAADRRNVAVIFGDSNQMFFVAAD